MRSQCVVGTQQVLMAFQCSREKKQMLPAISTSYGASAVRMLCLVPVVWSLVLGTDPRSLCPRQLHCTDREAGSKHEATHLKCRVSQGTAWAPVSVPSPQLSLTNAMSLSPPDPANTPTSPFEACSTSPATHHTPATLAYFCSLNPSSLFLFQRS